MNPANLPFDSEAMLQGLRGWVECESPTFDAGAVERMLDIAARVLPPLPTGLFFLSAMLMQLSFSLTASSRFPNAKGCNLLRM